MLSKKIFRCVAIVLVLAVVSPVSANLIVNGTFDTGTDGWTPSENAFYSTNGNPGGCLAMDSHGAGGDVIWIVSGAAIPVTAGLDYVLNFDYTTTTDGSSAVIHFYSASGYLGNTSVYDTIVWGWVPSLNVPEAGQWINKTGTFAASECGDTVENVLVQFMHRGAWGESRFDNVTLDVVPEPATMLLLGLGCLGLVRRKRS
jgi:hypothetical protein